MSGTLSSHLANARAFYFAYGDAVRISRPDLMLYRSRARIPRRNGVLWCGREDGRLKSAIEEARACFEGTPWLWWVSREEPPELAERLLAEGFAESGSLPVM